jgi:hypothetical protein
MSEQSERLCSDRRWDEPAAARPIDRSRRRPPRATRGLAAWSIATACACTPARDSTGRDAAPARAAITASTAAAVPLAVPAPVPVDAPPAAVLSITAQPPPVGASSVITFEATLDFDLNFGGLETITSSKQSKRKKVEILAVRDDGAVEKRITYLKRKTDIVIDGERRKDDTILPGKTFRVTFLSGEGVLDVRRANGKPATAAEVAAVKGEEILLQTPEMLGRALAGLELVEGVPFEVPMAMIEKLMVSEYKARRLTLVYKGSTPEGERIDAQGSMGNDGEGLKMFVDLDARLILDRTGWCLQADVTAQVRAEFGGTVVGSGAGLGVVRATPLR